MVRRSGSILALLALALATWPCACASGSGHTGEAGAAEEPFAGAEVGARPQAPWRVEATNPGASRARWEFDADPERGTVLRLARIESPTTAAYNLCWRLGAFRDGTISVEARARTGRIDQGGGLLWRVQDANHYYVARYNPLEQNLRVYKVIAGRRTQVASREDLTIGTNQWFALRVVHEGTRIRCFLDGQLLLEAEDDALPGGGGVGLWTKADAATDFARLRIEPR